MVALVEHGGAGGKHAAPIAFDAVRAYLQHVREQREGTRAGVAAGAKGRKQDGGGGQ